MEHREDHNEIPEFTLEDILAEFGSGSDLYRTEDLPAEENSPETAPAEAPATIEPGINPNTSTPSVDGTSNLFLLPDMNCFTVLCCRV